MLTASTERRFDGSCNSVGGALRGQLLEQTVEAVPALARGDKTLPVRDREIDRRQRPRAQDSSPR